MEKDLKVLEENINNGTIYCLCGNTINKAIENLIKGYKELQEQRDSLMWQRNTIDIPKIEELQEENRNIKNHIYYKEVVELNYIPKSKAREVRKEFDEMVQKLYAEGKEITERDVFILFDKLLEGDDK